MLWLFLRLQSLRTINFVACCLCFKTAVSADNLLGVVGVLRLISVEQFGVL